MMKKIMINNLDEYIIENIKAHEFNYFSFLYSENLWIKQPKSVRTNTQLEFYEYLSTYTKLHFVIDNWNSKYLQNLTYLTHITEDDKNIVSLLSTVLNKDEMIYRINNIFYPVINKSLFKYTTNKLRFKI